MMKNRIYLNDVTKNNKLQFLNQEARYIAHVLKMKAINIFSQKMFRMLKYAV